MEAGTCNRMSLLLYLKLSQCSASASQLNKPANGSSEPTESGLPEGGNGREPGVTSKGDLRSNSRAISRTAGTTSLPSSLMLLMRSSRLIGPSFCQKKKIPGRRHSSTVRIFGNTLLGVPQII